MSRCQCLDCEADRFRREWFHLETFWSKKDAIAECKYRARRNRMKLYTYRLLGRSHQWGVFTLNSIKGKDLPR